MKIEKGELIMSGQGLTMKQLAEMINGVMGRNVLNEHQLQQIMEGARRANDRGGMSAVLDYLMKVTQADIDKSELHRFADQVQSNPQMGMDILLGKKKPSSRRKR